MCVPVTAETAASVCKVARADCGHTWGGEGWDRARLAAAMHVVLYLLRVPGLGSLWQPWLGSQQPGGRAWDSDSCSLQTRKSTRRWGQMLHRGGRVTVDRPAVGFPRVGHLLLVVPGKVLLCLRRTFWWEFAPRTGQGRPGGRMMPAIQNFSLLLPCGYSRASCFTEHTQSWICSRVIVCYWFLLGDGCPDLLPWHFGDKAFSVLNCMCSSSMWCWIHKECHLPFPHLSL